MFLHGFQHGTTWLVGVGAVAETALLGKTEYILEIASELLRLDVERAESLDARRVDDIAAERQWDHLAKGGGVHS